MTMRPYFKTLLNAKKNIHKVQNIVMILLINHWKKKHKKTLTTSIHIFSHTHPTIKKFNT